MKSFTCGDVIPGCGGSVTAPDEAGIVRWATAHVAEVHGITEVTPEMVVQLRASIVTV